MRYLWFVLFFALQQPALAATDLDDEDLTRVEIYLHTINVGNLIFNNFGHTAIRVKDPNKGTDLVYNWGLFDFSDPLSFSLKFYRGDLIYSLGVYPTYHALRSYRREQRQVWEDQLGFTPQQKRVFLEKIRRNALPENSNYPYDYFFDNCATRPRDFIDLTLDGKLKQSTASYGGMTFRDMVRSGYQYNPEMDFLLEIGMNGRIDRVISRWEAMFHPLELRKELLKLEINGERFIKSSKVLFAFPTPSGQQHIFKILGIILLVPISVCIFLLQKVAWQRYRQEELSTRLEKAGLRLLGITTMPLVGILGLCGLLMPLNWLFSGHQDLHHNLNMLFFLPTDLVFTVLGANLLIKGKAIICSLRFYKLAKRYVLLHIALATGAALSWSMGDSVQDIGRVIYIAVPYIMVLALSVNFGLVAEGGAHEQPGATH